MAEHEDDRLNLTLEEVIRRNTNTFNNNRNNNNKRTNDNNTGLKYRGRSGGGGSNSSNRRADRSSKPYDDGRQRSHRNHNSESKQRVARTITDDRHRQQSNDTHTHASNETHDMNELNKDTIGDNNTNTMFIMFLISNPVAGLIIGRGGDRIRKFSAITQTVINISHHDDLYPGTLFRYVKIQGTLEAVCLTISILWEIIALEEVENSLISRNIWNPTNRMTHQFDHVKVEGKLIVPAKTVGSIIGKDMSTIKFLVDTTHATVHFAKRYEPSLPGYSDRILTIAGETMNCVKVSAMIVEKVFKWFIEGHGSSNGSAPDTARSSQSHHSSGNNSHDYEVHYQPSRSHTPLPHQQQHSAQPWAVAGREESPRSLTVVSSSNNTNRSRSNSHIDAVTSKRYYDDGHDDYNDDNDDDGRSNMDENEYYDDDDDDGDNNNNTTNNYIDDHYDDYNDNNFSTSSSSNYNANNSSNDNRNSHRNNSSSYDADRDGSRRVSRIVVNNAHEYEAHSTAPRRKSHGSTTSSDSGGSSGGDRRSRNHHNSNNNNNNNNSSSSNNNNRVTHKHQRSNTNTGSDHAASTNMTGLGRQTAAIVSASTTVSLAVANTAIGNLFGLKGAVLHELRQWSGAEITIAPRKAPIPASAGSSASSHTHRLVTVQGEPAVVAEACRLITALLEGGSGSVGSVPNFSKL